MTNIVPLHVALLRDGDEPANARPVLAILSSHHLAPWLVLRMGPMSVSELAGRSGVDEQKIGAVLRGEGLPEFSAEEVGKLAGALGADTDELKAIIEKERTMATQHQQQVGAALHVDAPTYAVLTAAATVGAPDIEARIASAEQALPAEGRTAFRVAVRAVVGALPHLPGDVVEMIAIAAGLPRPEPIGAGTGTGGSVVLAGAHVPVDPCYIAGTRNFDLSRIPEAHRSTVEAIWSARKDATEARQIAVDQAARARVATIAAETREKFGRVPGRVDELATLRLAVADRCGAPELARLDAVLTGYAAVAATAQHEVGSSRGPSKAEEEVTRRAKEIAAEQRCTIAAARNRLWATPEGRELHRRMREESAS